MTNWDCGNCNHHWQAGQHQECCPKCNSWHVMSTDDWSVEDAIDQAMGNNHAYAEELTPEGIQLVITGAERITEPTEADKQGKLW
tara:strand:+ start:70 stop:324 length:255 start_codon:yes stop_codon:yes gene_type:complete